MTLQDIIHRDPIAAAFYVVRVFLLLVVLGVAMYSLPAEARPMAVLDHGDIRVTLYDEPCKLDVQLPYRAVWKDKEKTYEGCFGVNNGIVIGFFADKSVAVFPPHLFKPVTES